MYTYIKKLLCMYIYIYIYIDAVRDRTICQQNVV